MAFSSVHAETVGSKYVGYGWESVACLCGWNVVDVRFT